MLEEVSFKFRLLHRIIECHRLVQHEAAAISGQRQVTTWSETYSPALLETTLE